MRISLFLESAEGFRIPLHELFSRQLYEDREGDLERGKRHDLFLSQIGSGLEFFDPYQESIVALVVVVSHLTSDTN